MNQSARLRQRFTAVACVLAIVLALVVTTCRPAPTAPGAVAPPAAPVAGLPPQLVAEFVAAVEAELAYYHIPGGAIAIVHDGQIVHAQGLGVRNIATGEPFTPETQFRPGSTGKSLTSLMLAQLVDRGALAWDTPVTRIMPSFATSDPALTARLTVGDLMGMGTGLVNDSRHALHWDHWTVEDLFQSIAAQPVQGAYGQFYSYNNELYAAAAYIGLVAAGREPTLADYTSWMYEHVTGPIFMPSAVLTDDLATLSDNRTQSYEVTLLGGVETPSPMPDAPVGVIGPAGGWWMNILDMARYLVTQMNGGVTPDGTRIVSAESLARTWQPGVVVTEEALVPIMRARYGMGWMVGSYRGVPIRFHGGGWKGYQTMMAIFPEHNTGLLVFVNHVFGSAAGFGLMLHFAELLGGLEPEILSAVHQRFEDDLRRGATQARQLPAYHLQPTVAAVLGIYEGGWRVELRDDQTLWLLRPGWEYLLYPLASPAHAFIVANYESMGSSVSFQVVGERVLLQFADAGLLSVPKTAEQNAAGP